GERIFDAMLDLYRRSLGPALRHSRLVMLVLLGTLGLNVFLYIIVPKGFFPQQDTGRMVGFIQADQSTSFQSMQQKLTQFVAIIRKDPAVDTVVAFTRGGQTNSGFVFASLTASSERKLPIDRVIGRLRGQLTQVPGAQLFLQPVQDIRVGGRRIIALYQYTVQSADLAELNDWTPKILAALQKLPQLTDVNSDQQNKGLEVDLAIDRQTAARFGINVSQIDNTLYDAFGQRQVSTIYNPRNQYHVIMEVAPRFWQRRRRSMTCSSPPPAARSAVRRRAVWSPAPCRRTRRRRPARRSPPIRRATSPTTRSATPAAAPHRPDRRSTNKETMVPLSTMVRFAPGSTPLGVNHQGLFISSTISFNLAPGVSLGQGQDAINAAISELGVPVTIRGTFQGTARAFIDSLANEPYLIAAALFAVYIVLGVLYESYIHPITILSTLPSAGVGAVLALMICHTEFSIIALI